MSLIVTTSLGRFRAFVDARNERGFLFECPCCKEWLPMEEEHLNGSRDVSHFRRDGSTLCEYSAPRPFGATLVATMQAKHLMAAEGEDVKPYDTDYASLYLGE